MSFSNGWVEHILSNRYNNCNENVFLFSRVESFYGLPKGYRPISESNVSVVSLVT